jgi:pyrroloquinoline quinone biosynthesis protein D
VKALDLRSCPQLASPARLQTDRLTGQAVLLFPEGILELNATSGAILARCDGRTTIAQIVAALADEYEGADSELRADVLEFLEELHRRRLLQVI